jgi:hypothetical protein
MATSAKAAVRLNRLVFFMMDILIFEIKDMGCVAT